MKEGEGNWRGCGGGSRVVLEAKHQRRRACANVKKMGLKTGLDRALGNLIQWAVTLPVVVVGKLDAL